jgi:hypothetical protein
VDDSGASGGHPFVPGHRHSPEEADRREADYDHRRDRACASAGPVATLERVEVDRAEDTGRLQGTGELSSRDETNDPVRRLPVYVAATIRRRLPVRPWPDPR